MQRKGHGKCWEGMFGEERASLAELTAPTLRPHLWQTAAFRRGLHCVCVYLLPCLCSLGEHGDPEAQVDAVSAFAVETPSEYVGKG